MKENKWYQGKVISGKKIGRKIDFPTLNLYETNIPFKRKKGVYVARIKIRKKLYNGLLYYGPRLILGEKKNILEIFVFNFKEKIYGETVSFIPLKYLRQVKRFSSLEALRKQLITDFNKAQFFLKKF